MDVRCCFVKLLDFSKTEKGEPGLDPQDEVLFLIFELGDASLEETTTRAPRIYLESPSGFTPYRAIHPSCPLGGHLSVICEPSGRKPETGIVQTKTNRSISMLPARFMG